MALVAEAAVFLEEAESHFEASLTFNRNARYDSETAWTCCDYADLLLERGSPKDLQLADKLLEEGLGLAEAHGMVTLAKRIRERQKDHFARTTYPDGLSARMQFGTN